MEPVNIPELVERLGSNEDNVRKMAAFKLQSSIGDPSFADIFIQAGGLPRLRWLALNATGNTLAYSLSAYSRMLEVDRGWEDVDTKLIKKAVELVVTHPLVNILRGAMSVLAAIVSHPASNAALSKGPYQRKLSYVERFGFRALKPAIADFPQFLDMLVSRLSSADHQLCTNALALINSLMRDAITNGTDQEWPKFIKRLQELGVIRAVYGLMQGPALGDLALPLLEFQELTKILLRKWREVPVDLDRQEHRRVLKGIHLSSLPEGTGDEKMEDGKLRRNVPDWKKLGFHDAGPGEGFDDVGFLGMMDLADYCRKFDTGFQIQLLEQDMQPRDMRCPIARASAEVTLILYDHFEIDKADADDILKDTLDVDSRESLDRLFKPMLLQWSRLHIAGLHAYFKIWKACGAEVGDFEKVSELMRILLEAVLASAERTKDVHIVEEEVAAFGYTRLRELQMELFELGYEDSWGEHLQEMRDELNSEAVQFIKEQRIRCLLEGSWFPTIQATTKPDAGAKEVERSWGYVKLSPNRRYLHFSGFDAQGTQNPALDDLAERIDLATVSSVVSNVVTGSQSNPPSPTGDQPNGVPPPPLHPRISINGMVAAPATGPTESSGGRNRLNRTNTNLQSGSKREVSLLTLHPETHQLAAEWLDGLLMLLNQAPITSETTKLMDVVSDWGLKIRLLNVRYEEQEDEGAGIVPSRDGLDDNYYYDVVTT